MAYILDFSPLIFIFIFSFLFQNMKVRWHDNYGFQRTFKPRLLNPKGRIQPGLKVLNIRPNMGFKGGPVNFSSFLVTCFSFQLIKLLPPKKIVCIIYVKLKNMINKFFLLLKNFLFNFFNKLGNFFF